MIRVILPFLLLFISSSKKVETSDSKLFFREQYKSESHEIVSVVAEELYTNIYIWTNSKNEAILVNPAFKSKELYLHLKKQKIKPLAIFLTHNHWDHTQEASQLAQALKIPILTNDNQIAMGPTEVGAELSGDLRKVQDGEKLTFSDFSFQVISTRGTQRDLCVSTTKRAACFLPEIQVFKGSVGRCDLPGSECEKVVESINHLFHIVNDETLILPGHGKNTNKEHEVKYNPYLS